jgi:rhodanese-related sulfurtransferase
MIKAINRDILRKKLQESPGRVILMDVREKNDYEVEHIKGAISVPIGELLTRSVQNWGRDHEIIVYCGSFECPASSNAAKMLDDAGFENVLEYEGGLKDWKTAGFMTDGADTARAA